MVWGWGTGAVGDGSIVFILSGGGLGHCEALHCVWEGPGAACRGAGYCCC